MEITARAEGQAAVGAHWAFILTNCPACPSAWAASPIARCPLPDSEVGNMRKKQPQHRAELGNNTWWREKAPYREGRRDEGKGMPTECTGQIQIWEINPQLHGSPGFQMVSPIASMAVSLRFRSSANLRSISYFLSPVISKKMKSKCTKDICCWTLSTAPSLPAI